jgi:hypothetical protein
MGYPAATGWGTQTVSENLAPMALRLRNSPDFRGAEKAVDLSFRSQQARAACFFLRAAPRCTILAQRRAGERGEWGSHGSLKHREVCADRLAKKQTARASDVFIRLVP